MKLTDRFFRRGFLAAIGLGAAAAVLAPSVGQAEEEHDAEYEQRAIEEIERSQYHEAIAQARADGYNRGREVEMARQEARQATVGPDAWSIGTARHYSGSYRWVKSDGSSSAAQRIWWTEG